MKILDEIQNAMKSDTTLVAVSKYRSIESIKYLNGLGIQDFGENRVQELMKKAEDLPEVRWHLIGRLQTNKVAQAIQYSYLIHSLDRIRLAQALQKEAMKQNKLVRALVQVNISQEETKAGFLIEELLPFLQTIDQYPNIRVEGLMCMGPHTYDEKKIRDVFRKANQLYHQISQEISHPFITMKFLSMGMSNDYLLALEEGSNMLRIGSLLFDAI